MAKIRLAMWDLGGQRDLQQLWHQYYSQCHAVVFVVDACDGSRLDEVTQTFKKVLENDAVEGVPILMLANKQDRTEALSVAAIKEIFNPLAAHLGARESSVLPISALSGTGVREAVDWLSVRVQRNKITRPPKFVTK